MIEKQPTKLDERLARLEQSLDNLSGKIPQGFQNSNSKQNQRNRIYIDDSPGNFNSLPSITDQSAARYQPRIIEKEISGNKINCSLQQQIVNPNNQRFQQNSRPIVKGWNQYNLFLLLATIVLFAAGTFMFIFGIYKLSTSFSYSCDPYYSYLRESDGICFRNWNGCNYNYDNTVALAKKQTNLNPGLPLLIFGIIFKVTGSLLIQKTYKFYNDNNSKWFD